MKEQWTSFLRFVTNSTALLALISVAVGTSWYFFRLEGRIETIEAQLQVLALAPALERKAADEQGPSTVVPNPLLEVCGQLALRVADAYEGGYSLSKASPIEDLMNRLGCEGKAQ